MPDNVDGRNIRRGRRADERSATNLVGADVLDELGHLLEKLAEVGVSDAGEAVAGSSDSDGRSSDRGDFGDYWKRERGAEGD